MNLTRFSLAVGAPAKWVLNTHALLRFQRDYSEAQARLLALTRVLEIEGGLSLGTAYRRALLLHGQDPAATDWEVRQGEVKLVVDRNRFLTRYALGLARARSADVERRRGRPKARKGSALARAEAYGVDLSLLQASLRKSPAERLLRLDEDLDFFRSLKVGRS